MQSAKLCGFLYLWSKNNEISLATDIVTNSYRLQQIQYSKNNKIVKLDFESLRDIFIKNYNRGNSRLIATRKALIRMCTRNFLCRRLIYTLNAIHLKNKYHAEEFAKGHSANVYGEFEVAYGIHLPH